MLVVVAMLKIKKNEKQIQSVKQLASFLVKVLFHVVQVDWRKEIPFMMKIQFVLLVPRENGTIRFKLTGDSKLLTT